MRNAFIYLAVAEVGTEDPLTETTEVAEAMEDGVPWPDGRGRALTPPLLTLACVPLWRTAWPWVCGDRDRGPEEGLEAVEDPPLEGDPQRRDEPSAREGEPDIRADVNTHGLDTLSNGHSSQRNRNGK